VGGVSKNEVGNRFGKLVVVERSSTTNAKQVIEWVCQCDCGNTVIKRGDNLRRGFGHHCGCSITKPSLRKDPKHVGSLRAYANYKKAAAHRNLSFDLSLEVFRSFLHRPCEYCNDVDSNCISLSTGLFFHYNGLDRIDSSLGYFPTNIVPCCRTCNVAKAEMSVDEFKLWVVRVYNNVL
jgi:hypothetical protein